MHRQRRRASPSQRIWFAVAVALVASATLWLVFAISPLLTSDPGAPKLSWADKLTAIGTVGAVAATLIITLITYFRDRGNRQREASERDERSLKGQASQIQWWLEPCPDHIPEWDGEDYGTKWLGSRTLSDCWGSRLVIENRSDLPIHDANPVMTEKIILQQTLGNWSIGPSRRSTFHLAGEGECLLEMVGGPRPYLLFRDHLGRSWRRDEKGTLSKVDDGIDLSDEMIELSSAAYRTLKANYTHQASARKESDEIKRVVSPLISLGLEGRSPEELEQADSVAFKLLQTARRGGMARRFAEAWWAWRAGRLPSRRVEDAVRWVV